LTQHARPGVINHAEKHLAQKLKQIRLRLEWTQQQLAEHLELDSGAISRFETGQRDPSLLDLLEYARLGRTTMEVLVSDKTQILAPSHSSRNSN
jgi:transcriptional regulator with XRE-family HTH domain